MKKIFSTPVLLILGCSVFSQTLKNSVAGNPEVYSAVTVTASDNTPASSANISARALKNFKKSFKIATDEKLYEMPDGYRVKFKTKGAHSNIFYKVDYDKKGNWIHTIRSYDEKELSSSIRDQVRMTYLDYTIALVDEITQRHNQITYVLHLEGSADWINVKIDDGEIVVLKRYNK